MLVHKFIVGHCFYPCDFTLTYKVGKDNVVADALSRLPSKYDLKTATPVEYIKLVEALNFDDISFQLIKKQNMNDEVLCQLINNIKLGWHKDDARLSDYGSVKSDLSL